MKILTLCNERYALIWAVDVLINGAVIPVFFTTRKGAEDYKARANAQVVSEPYASLRWVAKAR